jgi:tetratricopeptide (TPR) repeat protein
MAALTAQAQAAQALLQKGLALHQHGRVEEAREHFKKILARDPKQFDALYLLGLSWFQSGKAELAATLIKRAIAVNPSAAAAHCLLGSILNALRRPLEALQSANTAIGLAPAYAEAYRARARALLGLGHPAEALATCDKAIALQPSLAEAHCDRGDALQGFDDLMEALASYDRAIGLKPGYAEAHNSRGLVLERLGQAEEALASYQRAVALDPSYAEAHSNRGDALQALGRSGEALASYDQAIALKPDFAHAHNNRGVALDRLGRPQEALTDYDRAIALDPSYADAHSNRGAALQSLARHPEAIASYDRAIELQPDDAEARFNRSLGLLACGQFEAGWRAYEWRKTARNLGMYPFGEDRLWLGDADLSGKVLLVTHEQGFGDTIQFCRYVKLLEDLGARVVLSLQGPLKSLLHQSMPTIRILAADEPAPPFDYHCPLMSLPLAFKTDLRTIPGSAAYLVADPEKSREWRTRLGPKAGRRVGLVWSGGFPVHQTELRHLNARRNLSFEQISGLNIDGIDFYSLQKGEPAESELADLRRQCWPSDNLHVLTSELHDFSDTAALIANLDLVISVDTSTAHLAGAMGKPVWILNRFDSCWRWLLDREDSPWYPSARLFRQPSFGDWGSVVAMVRAALAEHVARLDVVSEVAP